MPWKTSDACLIMASISAWVESVKPWRISHLNVPPGGSDFGFVQYTPVMPRLSWPP